MISRRLFLTVIGGAGSVAAFPALATPPAASAYEIWREAVGESSAVRSVGLQCLRCGAAESDPALLVRALRAGLAERGLDGCESDPATLREALGRVKRAEFATGEVVLVDGWMLARSEARSYALAAAFSPN